MKYATLILALLVSVAVVAQKRDTAAAVITVRHKLQDKVISFKGWVVYNGRKKRYYDSCWNGMPISYRVVKVVY